MGMTRIDITGGWIEYREPEQVPERLRREVMRLSTRGAKYADMENVDATQMEEADMVAMTDFMSDFNDAIAIALIHDWSFGVALNKEALLDLPGSAYDEIVKYCQPLISRLMPSFGVDGATDPKALTES
jgi:hypothetical protein